ncbi:hypothetical protein CES87_06420 [Pseudomonas sp. ERMR1:02]|nr:hypothetical protein CES87_06420 [Pseudomonas sp. ERMR1:02]
MSYGQTQPVAAGEACVRLRSSRHPDNSAYLKHRAAWFYDCCAAERRLRQLLHDPRWLVVGVKNLRRRFIVADLRFIK